MQDKILINEKSVSRRVGVPIARLRELRDLLREGRDWEIDEASRAVMWSEDGVQELLQLLEDSPDLQKKEKTAAVTHVDAVTLTVHKRVINRRLVLAVDAAGRVVRVQVRNSKKMRVGMILDRCTPVDDDGLYAFDGKPRRPMISPVVVTDGATNQ